jgi:preprotein translocase subunit SecE
MATAVQMSLFDRIKKYIGEVKIEATKVSWPTRDEVKESTIVVLIACTIIALFIFSIDLILGRIVRMILSS